MSSPFHADPPIRFILLSPVAPFAPSTPMNPVPSPCLPHATQVRVTPIVPGLILAVAPSSDTWEEKEKKSMTMHGSRG